MHGGQCRGNCVNSECGGTYDVRPILSPAIEVEPVDGGSVGSHRLEDNGSTALIRGTKFGEKRAIEGRGESVSKHPTCYADVTNGREASEVRAMGGETLGLVALQIESLQLRVADVNGIFSHSLAVDQ